MTEPGDNSLLQTLSARHEISNLIARYCMSVDDRDLRGLIDLFTEDAYFGSSDGSRGAHSRAAIFDYFRGRFEVMGPSYHWSHDRLIEPEGPDDATGLVLAHVEMGVSGQSYVGGLRYHDRYRREGGRWKIARRAYDSFYFVPPASYATALSSEKRVWAYGEWYDADIPEKLDSWTGWRDVVL